MLRNCKLWYCKCSSRDEILLWCMTSPDENRTPVGFRNGSFAADHPTRGGIRGYGETESPSRLPERSYHEVSYEPLQAILALIEHHLYKQGFSRPGFPPALKNPWRKNDLRTAVELSLYDHGWNVWNTHNRKNEKCTISTMKLCKYWRDAKCAIV